MACEQASVRVHFSGVKTGLRTWHKRDDPEILNIDILPSW